ncbi:MAG: hypothetical protein ACOCZQ_00855 [Nanoarchaeota archaeon]
MANELLTSLRELRDTISDIEKSSEDKNRHKNHKTSDFHLLKADYKKIKVNNCVEKLQNKIFALTSNLDKNNPDNDLILEMLKLSKNQQLLVDNLSRLIDLAGCLKQKSETSQGTIQIPDNLPDKIAPEIRADFRELERCFNAGCYRACTIICGRVIEVCLHRKYFEVVGVDLLEKNPGIGLGKLIAKMYEKNISLDPGLSQQVHLINQVRIYSVHKKSESFYPSKEQAYAMVLYTMDVVRKLF